MYILVNFSFVVSFKKCIVYAAKLCLSSESGILESLDERLPKCDIWSLTPVRMSFQEGITKEDVGDLEDELINTEQD